MVCIVCHVFVATCVVSTSFRFRSFFHRRTVCPAGVCALQHRPSIRRHHHCFLSIFCRQELNLNFFCTREKVEKRKLHIPLKTRKMSLRTTFSDAACTVCLTPFEELIGTNKITFANCQHTMCIPCLSKHMNGKTEVAKQTPCCKQPIIFAIQAQADVVSTQTFYKFKLWNVAGDRLFRAEPHYQYSGHVILRTLNDNMLKFNSVAEYVSEGVFDHVEVTGAWKQVYFQLPGHPNEFSVDDDQLHLVLLRVQENQLEFAWTDRGISITRVVIGGSVRLAL